MKTRVRPTSQFMQSDSELIRDPARLVPLLKRLSKQHAPLTVRFPGHGEHFTSYIVEVDKNNLLLDELLPNTGQPLLDKHRVIQASAKLNGVDIHFKAPLERVDNQKNMLTNYMSLPKQIEYCQRRSSYRVPIALSSQLRVIIEDDEGAMLHGELHDLSNSGAGLVFSDSEPVVQPDLLQECAIELIDGQWLYATVELRYSKNMPTGKRQLIGARFQGLGHEQSRMVNQCVNALEREIIKKRASS
jgi:c-di-GMP-binding flagellar brake protein YcgR